VLQSVLLVAVTALLTWIIASRLRLGTAAVPRLSAQQKEANRARNIGDQLDGARERASSTELERNKLALAKAVKAALWVADARLNVAVPELLKMAQLWAGKSKSRGTDWKPPEGVTRIEGRDDPESPWAAWNFKGHDWRIESQCRPSILPDESEGPLENCTVLLDRNLVLDMTISSKDRQVMWLDALTVGPWVSDLLSFAGARTSDAKARSSARSARENQQRADNIHWS
jgi:hypothetical protein